MKLYVIPLSAKCNGRCKFCITKFRETKEAEELCPERLQKVLQAHSFEKIEITGGGEPGLHPKIDQIIDICSKFAPTQIYTNGTYAPPLDSQITSLCLSRAHYSDLENQKIMGISSRIENIKIPLKLSLLAHKSGISNEAEAIKYLEWANDFAAKVVIRKLFLHKDNGYQKMWGEEYVDTTDWLKSYKAEITENGGRLLRYKGLAVEIEGRDCACENNNPVLLANGSLEKGWGG